MKTLTQYREDVKSLIQRVDDIQNKATSENRNLTTDEVEYLKEVNTEIASLTDMIKTIEESDKLRAALTTPEQPQTVEKKRPAMSVQVKDKEKFRTIGEQMSAVMRAGMPGGHIDPRLYNATGLNETTPSDGGFLVQTDFSSELLQQVYQTGILAPRCRRISISGNSNGIKINGVDETSRASTRSGGIIGYWKDEAAQKTASKPKFRQIELTLHKLIGLCYATDELLSDASALEGFIRQAFAAEFGFLLDDAIIRGSGAGQPLGILNAGCLVTVPKEGGQGKTIIWENVVKMYARLFAGSRPNAVWLINQAAEAQLMQMAMSVGTGGVPVYLPAGGASQSPYATLFGRPVIAIEQCSALGDVGDIIFGDFNGYIIAEKGGIESAMSIHVKFDYDESVFRFVMRVDGQPVRASSLTPYKGSDSLSHFVALAAR